MVAIEQSGRLPRSIIVLFTVVVVLSGCSPPEPLRLGFLGGISGRVADLGIAGRNGAALAVEMRNKGGGINGRMVELLVEDDRQDPETAKMAVARLIERKVEAIVGPLTSAMAVATVPLANEAKLLMVSPTVTTPALSGLDDYFFRVLAPSTINAGKCANYHFHQQGRRRIAAAYDLRNQAYTESWLTEYRRVFEAAGGVVSAAATFNSSEETQFGELAENLLGTKPDAVLVLANSVDAALLAQQFRKRDATVSINAAEWAATEHLIELGGRDVEGMVMAQFMDRNSTQPAYLAFRKAYLERFAQEPGFTGLAGFDSANVVLDALQAKPAGQTLKQVILTRGVFTGAQSEIRFDATGDAARGVYMTIIRNGAFERLD